MVICTFKLISTDVKAEKLPFSHDIGRNSKKRYNIDNILELLIAQEVDYCKRFIYSTLIFKSEKKGILDKKKVEVIS